MPRTPDFDRWPFHPANRPDEQVAYHERLTAQFEDEIRQSAAAQAFFAGYAPDSVALFIQGYARAKAYAVLKAGAYIPDIEGSRNIRFPDDTRDAFDAILQKKLFNIQLLWRNGQLDLRPHVRLSVDFEYWDEHIRSCPFLGGVSAEELDTLRAYLLQPYFDYDAFSNDDFHQYYHTYVSRDEDGTVLTDLPDWFEFYDLRHETGGLLVLPDLRGATERRYSRAAWQKQKAASETGDDREPAEPRLPALYRSQENWVAFAEAADDACFEAIFRRQLEEDAERESAERVSGVPCVRGILDRLASITDLPSVPRAGVSWQQAVADVWNAHLSEAVAADLAVEWETYELYRTAGIVHPERPKWFGRSSEGLEEARQWLADLILDGREALGEPRDLDIF